MNHPFEDSLFGIIDALEAIMGRFNDLDEEESDIHEEIDDTNIVADVEYKEVKESQETESELTSPIRVRGKMINKIADITVADAEYKEVND